MLQELKKYLPARLLNSRIPEKEAGAAYDIWSANYDNQPGNLMLDLDEVIFRRMLSRITVADQTVADIGCGTGRHWDKILQQLPAQLTGFDVSMGMLNKLRDKFPKAELHQITDNRLPNVPTAQFDLAVSTLTVAHIKNIEDALLTWCRITKDTGDILITDFHPDALANGGKRTFKHGNGHIAVRNFVHHLASIKAVMNLKGWKVANEEQAIVNDSVRHYYESQNAMHVYHKFKGTPIIYGLHFKQTQ